MNIKNIGTVTLYKNSLEAKIMPGTNTVLFKRMLKELMEIKEELKELNKNIGKQSSKE